MTGFRKQTLVCSAKWAAILPNLKTVWISGVGPMQMHERLKHWHFQCDNVPVPIFSFVKARSWPSVLGHRLGFLASTWWVMACSPVISTQLALVKWMPASFRSIRESWRMSGKNYLTQITSKFWLWADASVFQLLQGLLKQARAVWRDMLVNASSHARSCTKGHVLQRTTEVHSGEAASWCFLRDSVLASEGKRAVASDECCQLFTLYLFTKVPWTGNLQPVLLFSKQSLDVMVDWQAVCGSRILPKLCLLWPRMQNRTERHAHCGWLLEWVVRRYESEASHRALCAFALTCTQPKTKLPKAINTESSTCLVPEDDTVGSGCSVGL